MIMKLHTFSLIKNLKIRSILFLRQVFWQADQIQESKNTNTKIIVSNADNPLNKVCSSSQKSQISTDLHRLGLCWKHRIRFEIKRIESDIQRIMLKGFFFYERFLYCVLIGKEAAFLTLLFV